MNLIVHKMKNMKGKGRYCVVWKSSEWDAILSCLEYDSFVSFMARLLLLVVVPPLILSWSNPKLPLHETILTVCRWLGADDLVTEVKILWLADTLSMGKWFFCPSQQVRVIEALVMYELEDTKERMLEN